MDQRERFRVSIFNVLQKRAHLNLLLQHLCVLQPKKLNARFVDTKLSFQYIQTTPSRKNATTMHTTGSSRFSLKHRLQHDKQIQIPFDEHRICKSPPVVPCCSQLLYYKRKRSLQTLVGIIHVKVGNDEIVFISESEI